MKGYEYFSKALYVYTHAKTNKKIQFMFLTFDGK